MSAGKQVQHVWVAMTRWSTAPNQDIPLFDVSKVTKRPERLCPYQQRKIVLESGFGRSHARRGGCESGFTCAYPHHTRGQRCRKYQLATAQPTPSESPSFNLGASDDKEDKQTIAQEARMQKIHHVHSPLRKQ